MCWFIFQYGGQEVVVVLSGESTDRFHSENESLSFSLVSFFTLSVRFRHRFHDELYELKYFFWDANRE